MCKQYLFQCLYGLKLLCSRSGGYCYWPNQFPIGNHTHAGIRKTLQTQRIVYYCWAGFTLIEILVAIVVISVGLLGVATMQIKGLKNNNSAFYRTQASVLADVILESMRANRKVANNAGYNIGLADSTPTGTGIAEVDLKNWRNSCGSLLPNCNTAVSYTSSTGVVRVTIQWDDSRGSAGGNTQSFILDSQLCDPGGNSCQ